MSRYDDPPPDPLTDPAELIANNRCRFCNRLDAFIEVEDGRDRRLRPDGRRAGGLDHAASGLGGDDVRRRGVPDVAPGTRRDPHVGDLPADLRRADRGAGARAVNRPPYIQFAAPTAWTPSSSSSAPTGRRADDWSAPATSRATGSTIATAVWLRRAASSISRPGQRSTSATGPRGETSTLRRSPARSRARSSASSPPRSCATERPPSGPCSPAPISASRGSWATSSTCCSTAFWRSLSTAHGWPRLARARCWVNGHSSKAAAAPRRCARSPAARSPASRRRGSLPTSSKSCGLVAAAKT